MHKIGVTLSLILVLTLHLQAQSNVSKSRWKSKEIIIDGNDHEWQKPLNFYDDNSGLLFAICNDNHNLYFAFTVNNELKMRKIMSAGWLVELSSKEKNKKFNATLIFPGVKIMGTGIRRPSQQFEKKVEGNPMIKDYQSQLQAISAKGFLSGQATLQLNDHHGIDIAIGADSAQFIVYEIAIPLKELMADNFIKLDELITLNVSVNALDRPNSGGGQTGRSGGRSGGGRSEMGGEMGGMGGGRSGSRMGGGRPGGGMQREGGYNGNGSGERSAMFEKVSFKQKFTLTGN
jgi:hypothetical protein